MHHHTRRTRWLTHCSVAALAFAVLLIAAPASAQCNSTATSADRSQGYGTLWFEAGTTQINCSGRTTRVEGWLDGVSMDCSNETFDQYGNCLDEDDTSSAGVTIFSQVGLSLCGTWNGKSNHRYRVGGSTTTIQENRVTPLNGGQCAQDCSVYGPGYWWNGYECTNQATPIIVSTRRTGGYKLTSAADGVLFDLDADGVPEQVAWTRPGANTAFLAIDVDGDGQITSGKELFGNNTVPGALTGFDALSSMAMETNGGERRGSVSSADPLFARLLLWTDRNHNGVSEPSELRPASEVVSDIGVGYGVSQRPRRDEFGNVFLYKGWVHLRTRPGRNETKSQDENEERTRTVWDVVFARQP